MKKLIFYAVCAYLLWRFFWFGFARIAAFEAALRSTFAWMFPGYQP